MATPRGHRKSIIGAPAFVCSGRGGRGRLLPTPPAWSAPRDRQAEAIAERDRERARRALHLSDERTPLSVIEGLAA